MAETAYFISDAHLGIECPGYEARENDLIAFLRTMRKSGDTLFIAGDLFDFWIEYRHAIRPEYFAALHNLRLLVESGVIIHYVAGNHDFALGPFLEKNIGMNLHHDHLRITMQGRKIHIHHGDGLIAQEFGYLFLKFMLRNRINQAAYKLLHPDIGVKLGKFFSGSSRHLIKRSCTEAKRAQYRIVARKYLARGDDIVVFGHTHHPELYDYNGKIFCNTGEWIRRYTYAKLENGKISLWEYRPGADAHEIAPVYVKNKDASAS